MDKDKKLLKEALFKRAIGYEVEEKEVIAAKNGKPERIKITRRHIPPDTKTIEKVMRMMACGKW